MRPYKIINHLQIGLEISLSFKFEDFKYSVLIKISFLLGYIQTLENKICPTIYPYLRWERTDGFIPFSWALIQSETQTNLFRIWTWGV